MTEPNPAPTEPVNPALINSPGLEGDPAPADPAPAVPAQTATDPVNPDSQADGDASTGAPENYEDFTLPEGLEANTGLMEQFGSVAKELDLTQDQAQQLVTLQAEDHKAYVEGQQKQWEDLQESWREAARTDKEFGGHNLDANIGAAQKAIKAFGNEGLEEALELTGTGNHPEVLRFLIKVGKAIGEDSSLLVGQAKQPPVDPAKILFPNQN